MEFQKPPDSVQDILHICQLQAMVDSDMNPLAPQELGLGELPQPVTQVGKPRTLSRHGGEQGPGLDAVLFQKIGELGPAKRSLFLHDDGDGVGTDPFSGVFLNGGQVRGELAEALLHEHEIPAAFAENIFIVAKVA